jgi:hypothetical protein
MKTNKASQVGMSERMIESLMGVTTPEGIDDQANFIKDLIGLPRSASVIKAGLEVEAGTSHSTVSISVYAVQDWAASWEDVIRLAKRVKHPTWADIMKLAAALALPEGEIDSDQT